MNLQAVEESLEGISAQLDGVEEKRERLLRESRDVISLSAKAILSIHTGSLKDAHLRLGEAEALLRALRRVAVHELRRYLTPPEAEYVEASVLYAIATKEALPSYHELRVGGTSYLLGLLDCIGEVKRLVIDRIREGRTQEATTLFGLMERLYVLLSPFAIYDHVAQGVRRKLDVVRMLIEDTRSAVTEESRRSEFMRAMNDLSRRLPRRRRRASKAGE